MSDVQGLTIEEQRRLFRMVDGEGFSAEQIQFLESVNERLNPPPPDPAMEEARKLVRVTTLNRVGEVYIGDERIGTYSDIGATNVAEAIRGEIAIVIRQQRAEGRDEMREEAARVAECGGSALGQLIGEQIRELK